RLGAAATGIWNSFSGQLAAMLPVGGGRGAAAPSRGVASGGPKTGGVVHSTEKQALTDMAKGDKKLGATRADMKAYQDLNKELPDPYPAAKVRVDEGHPGR